MAKSICVDSVFHFISGFYDRQGPDLRHHYAGLRVRGRGPWTGKALKTRTPKPRSGIQTAVDYRQMHRGRNCLKAGRGGVGRRLIGCRTTNNTNNNNNNSINACDSDYSLVNIGNVFTLAQFLKDSLHVVGHTHTLSNLT